MPSLRGPLAPPMARPLVPPLERESRAGYNPASAFAAGAQGGWWDISDMATLFQDSAGTVPVTASGQPVGRVTDKSGRGNHLIQATAAARPTYTEAGGLRFLAFDGVDDTLGLAALNMGASDKLTLVSACRRDVNALTVLVEHSVDEAANVGTFLHYWDATGSVGLGVHGSASNPTTATGARGVPETIVVSSGFDLAGASSAASFVAPAINGVGALFTPAGPAPGAGNFGTFPLFVGARAGTSLFFTGNLYGLAIVGGVVSAANRTGLEKFIASRASVSL